MYLVDSNNKCHFVIPIDSSLSWPFLFSCIALKQIQDIGSLYIIVSLQLPLHRRVWPLFCKWRLWGSKKLNDSSKASQAEFSKRSVLAAGQIRHVLVVVIKTKPLCSNFRTLLAFLYILQLLLLISGVYVLKTHRSWGLSRERWLFLSRVRAVKGFPF